jgi:hypothetical protein
MGKRSTREREDTPRNATGRRRAGSNNGRLLKFAVLIIVIGAAVGVLVRSSWLGGGSSDFPTFKQVGRSGPVFTISVPKGRAGDEDYLMKIAEQLSAQDVQAGASGQISVMVWPDDVAVPKEPPTTELDASMRTQAAGIFVNPKMNIKHLIRFKDGQTVAERDFGKKVQ